MSFRTLAAALATLLLLAGVSACGDDDSGEAPEAQVPTTTAPATPAAPGANQLATLGGESRGVLIACLEEAGVEAKAFDYVGVASGSNAEFHFQGPAAEVHLGEEPADGEGEPESGGDEHGHGLTATVVTFESPETARSVHDAWAETGEAILEGDSVVLGEGGGPLEGPELESVRGCLAED